MSPAFFLLIGRMVQFGMCPPRLRLGPVLGAFQVFVFFLCWGFGCSLPDLIGGINDVPCVLVFSFGGVVQFGLFPPRLRQGPVLGVFQVLFFPISLCVGGLVALFLT